MELGLPALGAGAVEHLAAFSCSPSESAREEAAGRDDDVTDASLSCCCCLLTLLIVLVLDLFPRSCMGTGQAANGGVLHPALILGKDRLPALRGLCTVGVLPLDAGRAVALPPTSTCPPWLDRDDGLCNSSRENNGGGMSWPWHHSNTSTRRIIRHTAADLSLSTLAISPLSFNADEAGYLWILGIERRAGGGRRGLDFLNLSMAEGKGAAGQYLCVQQRRADGKRQSFRGKHLHCRSRRNNSTSILGTPHHGWRCSSRPCRSRP